MKRAFAITVVLLCGLGQSAICVAAEPPKTGEKRDTLIYVRSDPPGAKVFVDGKEIGTTNGLFPIEAGVATVVLRLEGHGQVKKQLTIQANGITRLEIELKPQTPSSEQTEPDAIATLRAAADAGNYFAKYELWAVYQKGAEGVAKNPENADKILREYIKGVYLAKFQPVNGFAPTTPEEFLANCNAHSSLRSAPQGRIGGASFFRTTAKDGVLIGSFLTENPDEMRKDIEANPSLKLISIEKLTPAMFISYEASPQESLPADDEAQAEKKRAAQVVEGVGWRGFRIGATQEQLRKAYGPLETSPGGTRKGWITRRHLDFWFDEAGHAVEVRFVRGFNLPLTSGVKIGSREKAVLLAYGSPDRVVNQPESKMLEYPKRGVLVWLEDGKVASFTVFKPRNAAAQAAKGNGQDAAQLADQQEKARQRMRQDAQAFSEQQRREIESLYQIANKKWQSEEARDSLKKLVDKYKKANRTGCAILYLGQMSQGDERIAYLKRAIADHSDCYYGDGVQVGAFARLLLGQTYLENGNADKAQPLFDEIRKDYPNSVDHRGNALVEQLPQGESRRAPAKTPQIVSMTPPNDAKDVDPAITELRVTFNVPMAGGFSWTGSGPHFPKTTHLPHWTADGKTCILPVELKPDWDYRLGLNSPSFKNFRSRSGVPLEPVVYRFTTRGATAEASEPESGDRP
jgi:hypothetical protein